ncbi:MULTISPECIES: hypothetical protein [unclassified Spirosoma]|uniref:hypothetical protein n=1 Tax=unclassified Spirosoma TaxID=2621999 RepID=UPI00095D92EA|nr:MULTISPECIES: hypothetical protein [unclassified Spirosoma]MBN8826885.1 hypothetical protein [Spirosoma sp.]OJW75569.1 MAG: hypothetical protein BGO59_08480 [Spirosoma sp. 48-14]
MEHQIDLKLIEGVFTHEDAREVLCGLLTYKINFHDLKNFSHMERKGKEHIDSLKRLTELKADKDRIVSWLKGIESGEMIRIQSEIKIYVENEQLAFSN